jgi:LPS export ABC transporter protein LptC
MLPRRFVFIFTLLFLTAPAILSAQQQNPKAPQIKTSEESDQQISEFSLAGYGEKGKKTWDLAGKSADIFTEVVKLNDVVGNMYGKEENIKLTADKGDFNKVDGRIRMEQNVVITTSSGTKLTTDSLDWDRKGQLVSTSDAVNIQRDNMTIIAKGAHGEPNLKKVALEKDVKLNINPEENKDKKAGETMKEKVIITCDGPLEIDYQNNIATFSNNVKVERSDSTIYSDKMYVYFIVRSSGEPAKAEGLAASKIDKIIAHGNVKVLRGENVSYSEEAIYTAADKKLILTGRPKLMIFSTEDFNAPSGN